jgi:L-aminopeptidase/D-esterase-like protein
VVSTNARIDKAACRIVAQGAHDGLARSITPPHTRFDGDAFIAAATGAVDADIDLIRYLALLTVTKAIQAFAGSGRWNEPCKEPTG